MKPVMQNVLWSADGIGNGNCLCACFASLLEIPLWMVPPFSQMFGRRELHRRIDEWFAHLGFDYVFTDGHEIETLPEFYIANGKSARGVMHSVIYSRGQLVHDPHYTGTGIESVEYTNHLAPIRKLP